MARPVAPPMPRPILLCDQFDQDVSGLEQLRKSGEILFYFKARLPRRPRGIGTRALLAPTVLQIDLEQLRQKLPAQRFRLPVRTRRREIIFQPWRGSLLP